MVFDGKTGARTGTIPLGGLQADHPDWSSDGARIAFTEVGVAHIDQAPERGGVSYVESAAGGAWSAPQRLVPSLAGKNRYYPAIAPDGSFLVYDESTCPAGKTYDRVCNADTDPSARLFAASFPPAPAAPVELAAANGPGVADRGATDLGTSYPKWNPFAFHVSAQSQILWLTFSPLRPAPVAAAGVLAREPARGHAHLDGRHRSGAARQGPGSELAGVLPAVPGHHDVQPHRAMDGRLRDDPVRPAAAPAEPSAAPAQPMKPGSSPG